MSQLSYDDNEFDPKDMSRSHTEVLDDSYVAQEIRKAIQELSEPFKTIVILRDIQELSYEDMSKILEIPIGTVKSRVNRARLKLQSLLKHLKE